MSTSSAAGSADSALKHNCSSSCPSASFLPSLWKRVLSLVPEISLFPPYLKTPPSILNCCDIQHPQTFHFPTSAIHPKPFCCAQRQFQAKASLTVHPLPEVLLPHRLPSPLWLLATEFLWAEVLQQQTQIWERQFKPQRAGTQVTLASLPTAQLCDEKELIESFLKQEKYKHSNNI